jgi:hypothetical protein
MDQRVALSTAGGVIATVCGTNAAAWAVGATASGSHLPGWPAYAFGLMAIIGLVIAVTAGLRIWPFHWLAVAPAELLDDCIRRGRDTRARIVYEKLDSFEAANAAAEWTLYTSNRLDRHIPALADHFTQAGGDDDTLSSQALTINTVAEKLRVLAAFRREIS